MGAEQSADAKETEVEAKDPEKRTSNASLPSTPTESGRRIKPKDKLLEAWQQLYEGANREPNLIPPQEATLSLSTAESWQRLLELGEDWHRDDVRKELCRQGAVCLVRAEWRKNQYCGLFRRADFGLARLSSGIAARESPEEPIVQSMLPIGSLAEARLIPLVAMKFFRGGKATSGNLLFAGRKTGQKETNFFAHCMCTHMTETCPWSMKPALSSLRRHTAWPCSLGLSDFAKMDQEGRGGLRKGFPWLLVLRPSKELPPAEAGEHFLQHLARLPPGTPLYDIFACPTPEDALRDDGLELLGRFVTVSHFVQPTNGSDARLRFAHQRKEDDYAIHSDWVQHLSPKHAECGWEHFEKMLEQRKPPAHEPHMARCEHWIWTPEAGAHHHKHEHPSKTGESTTSCFMCPKRQKKTV